MDGVVYAGFGSHCDASPFEGWVFGVSTSGQITARWATVTDGDGGGVWQAGAGLSSDGPGLDPDRHRQRRGAAGTRAGRFASVLVRGVRHPA